MKRLLLAMSLLSLVTSCRMGYGPLEDRSEFVSARLADDKCTVVFSAHRFAYRPAAGWRALPDRGIPDYVTDINILGTYDLRTRAVRILRREKNKEWQPGSGLFFIHSLNGSKVMVSRGGQLRGPFRHGLQHLLFDLKTGKVQVLDLKADLAGHGRDLGYFYMVDSAGTLVFVTLSLEEAGDSKARRNKALVPEIWVRAPAGDYVKVAASAHYEGVHNGEVIYWEPATRDFMAFSLAARTTRKAPEFKVPGYVDVDAGVILSANRKVLEFGVKTGGQWKYQPLELALDGLK